jgi:hypothetical protein
MRESFQYQISNLFLNEITQKAMNLLFNELKLFKDGNLDKAEILKHFEGEAMDASWKPIIKDMVEKCHKEVTATKDKIISEMEKAPLNIKPADCNVIPIAFVFCGQLQTFLVRKT